MPTAAGRGQRLARHCLARVGVSAGRHNNRDQGVRPRRQSASSFQALLSRSGRGARDPAEGLSGTRDGHIPVLVQVQKGLFIPLKLLPGSVKVPKQIFGRSAAVKVTFTLPKHFYGAPKNDAQGP